jgi:hypothetical protein
MRLTAEQRALLIRCVDGELSATRRMARSNFKDRSLAAEFDAEADRQETLLNLLRRAVSVAVSVPG